MLASALRILVKESKVGSFFIGEHSPAIFNATLT